MGATDTPTSDDRSRDAAVDRVGLQMVRRAAWTGVALCAALLLQSLYHQPVGWIPRAVVTGLAILAAARPHDALLCVAAFGPLSTVLFVVIRTDGSSVRFEEAVILAFLAGAGVRHAISARPLSVSLWVRWCATLLSAAALGSAAVTGAVVAAEQPGASFLRGFDAVIGHEYLISSTPLPAAMLFAECLVLLLVVGDICARDRSTRDAVLRMMVIGAAAAGLLNVVRIVTSAVRAEHAWAAFFLYLRTVRVNVHHADLNAAGSYFAMMAFVAAGQASRNRALALVSIVVISAGLWISGSRIALAAVLLTVAFAGAFALFARTTRRALPALALVVLVAIVAVSAWKWYPAQRNVNTSAAFEYRLEMANAGVRLAATHPWFGIGLGWFARLSTRYASIHENAHNNYIQIVAELGIPGLLLFLGILVAALREILRRTDSPGAREGLAAGLTAYLLTALGGHPLLVAGAAYPFWMALGVAAAPAGAVQPVPRWGRIAALMLVAALMATLPFRSAAAIGEADLENASGGFSEHWQRHPDGFRYRWAGGHAAFYITSAAKAVRIPLRLSADGPAVVEIRMFFNRRAANAVLLYAREDWRTVRLLVPQTTARTTRVDLEARVPGATALVEAPVRDTSGVFMVGRPIVEP